MTTLKYDTLARALTVAVAAAREAGDHLRADLYRADGPRGHGSHAEADEEAERMIRGALLAHSPDWGYRGEETGEHALDRARPFWLVDPNDGTSGYTRGHRGSAVSIALIDEGLPVLGVVFAFAAPDGVGDLFAWAEGGRFTRNGLVVERPALPASLTGNGVVLLNHEHEQHPVGSLAYVAPARYRSVPSVAYRLALVAAGDADATVSTGGPTDWDVAGGHALLRAVGGELVDRDGRPVRYRHQFSSNVYGGSIEVARTLASRGRARWETSPPPAVDGLSLAVPTRGAEIIDERLLRRSQGCLLGQLAGDALGAQVEFESSGSIARTFPDGVRDLRDGGTWNTLAGQPTDDSELALTLARCLLRDGRHDPARVADAYRAWLRSHPFDVGTTTRAGIEGAHIRESRSNGSLMRVSPLAVWAHARSDDEVAEMARAESAITHPNATCRDACAAFCVAIAHALRGDDARQAYDAACAWADRADADERVRDALARAEQEAPSDMQTNMGLVTLALQNAFHRLLHARDVESALVATVGAGGDTDTNAAIAGALLGATHGREAIPARWRRAVLSCRPLAGATGVARPRPVTYWPVDALVLAERLLFSGR